LETSQNSAPDLLTVEEAAAVLRIGRTKAYAMATEYRATGGASGLPVVDLGSVLRVPRHKLEELVGAPITTIPARVAGRRAPMAVVPEPASSERRRHRRARSNASDDQPALFPPDPAA
jgi:hypothetical protein